MTSNQTKPTIKEQIKQIIDGVAEYNYDCISEGMYKTTPEVDQATEQIIEVIDKEVIGGSEHKRDLSMFDAEMAEWQEENRLTRNALRKRQRQLLKGQTNE
jgi:hypothetical protein